LFLVCFWLVDQSAAQLAGLQRQFPPQPVGLGAIQVLQQWFGARDLGHSEIQQGKIVEPGGSVGML
jgi:hypothetical protein